MRVGVGLGLTICTDPENRNFAKVDFRIDDIDTDGDVEAQAKEGMDAIVTVFTYVNDGMEAQVIDSLTEVATINPEGVRDDLDKLTRRVNRITQKVVPNIVGHVKKVAATKVVDGKSIDEVMGGESTEGEESDA